MFSLPLRCKWESSISGTPLEGLIDPGTLLFKHPLQEQGFVALRHEGLVGHGRLALACYLAYIAFRIVFIILDLNTSGGDFEETHHLTPWAALRSSAFLLCALLCTAGVALLSSKRLCKWLGPAHVEKAIIVLLLLGLTINVPTNPWYSACLAGADAAAVVKNEIQKHDGRFLLSTDMLLTVSHLALPVRTAFLWVVPVWAVLVYAAAAGFLGSPHAVENVVNNVAIITSLAAFAFLGRRNLEIQQRGAFVTVASERVLRAQAEHQLHHAVEGIDLSQRVGAIKSVTGDAESMAPSAMTKVTVATDRVFSSETSLEEIAEVGRREHWLIPMEHILPDGDENNILGKGSFGLVMRARYHGALVVVKAPLRPDGGCRWLTMVAQELRMFRRLRHPNIVPFYGSVIGPKDTEIWLVLEYVSGTELDNVVGPKIRPGPHSGVRMQLARDVCFALTYLHAQWPPVVHGDIKPSNVLVEMIGLEMRAKLTDFGLSRLMTQRGKAQGGTRFWAAPEVLLGSTSPEPSCDVFSFGRLFYLTMNAQLPPETVPFDSQRVLEPTGASTGAQISVSQTLQWVFEVCTCTDPKQRPTMQRVSGHLVSVERKQSELRSQPVEQSSQDTLCAARACTDPKQRPTMQRVSGHLASVERKQSELRSQPVEQSFQDALCAARAARAVAEL